MFNTLSQKWKGALENGRTKRFSEWRSFPTTTEVETTTLDSLIERYGLPYFIKIDVEGYERHAIGGLSYRIPYISFELNLPEYTEEGIECLRLLSDLGESVEFNYIWDCRAGFRLDTWLPYRDFKEHLVSFEYRYMEVFARSEGQ